MSSLSAAPGAPVAARRPGLAAAILAAAAFVIVTTEYLVVGLLPALAGDLHVGVEVAGQLVTLFALTVMACGPVLTALLAHVDRKRLFVVILLAFAAADALAAVAPDLRVLALARIVPAMLLPVFWGTASDTAGRIAGPGRAGRAVARVYLGISAALLFGVPLGTLAGAALGWRGAFWLLAGLALVAAGLLQAWMPALERTPRQPVAAQWRLLRDRRLVGHVGLSVLVFCAMFTAYTYLADLLERLAGVPASRVGWWLMGFGAVGLVGNHLGGRLVERRPLGATALFTALLAVAMTACAALAQERAGLVASLAAWGIAYTALFPICQVRVMHMAPQAQALAGTLNVSAANAGTALGALCGGAVVHRWGVAAVAPAASLFALAALAATAALRRPRRVGP